MEVVINSLIVITTLICEIPPYLPFLAAQALAQRAKGRNYPSLAKRGEGRFSNDYINSILRPLIYLVSKARSIYPDGFVNRPHRLPLYQRPPQSS